MPSPNALDYWFDGIASVAGQSGALVYWFDGLPVTLMYTSVSGGGALLWYWMS